MRTQLCWMAFFSVLALGALIYDHNFRITTHVDRVQVANLNLTRIIFTKNESFKVCTFGEPLPENFDPVCSPWVAPK